MLKIENTKVVGFEEAIRGMRNPMNSWDKSDSYNTYIVDEGTMEAAQYEFFLGEKDHELAIRLSSSGPVHGKYKRMIVVYADITAPLYWWKEFDTYKVGTVANSCSTMHKIHVKEFTREDFSCEHLIGDKEDICIDTDWTFSDTISGGREDEYFTMGIEDDIQCIRTPVDILDNLVAMLNACREAYLLTKNKKYWWQMIQLLPTSYNQKRTVMLNYEVLTNIYFNRKDHKLDEWHTFCDWIEQLPDSDLIIGEETPKAQITPADIFVDFLKHIGLKEFDGRVSVSYSAGEDPYTITIMGRFPDEKITKTAIYDYTKHELTSIGM